MALAMSDLHVSRLEARPYARVTVPEDVARTSLRVFIMMKVKFLHFSPMNA